MKTLITICAIILMVSGMAPAADVAGWESFVIRNADGGGASPQINDITYGGTDAKEFIITASGMKAGWGSNLANGSTVSDLAALSIDRLDDYTRFTAGSGPYVAPYLNIWITDGAGNYAVLANEPSNPEWTGTSEWDMTWDILKTKIAKVYEYGTNTSWLPAVSGLTFEAYAGCLIGTPTSQWGGTGAPDDLNASTYTAYGVNWVFGDTLSNYVSGDPGYIIANPTIVPEPATMLLLGLGGLLLRRNKRA